MKNQAEGAEPRQGFSAEWKSQKSDCKGNLDGANVEPWRLEKQVNLYTQANPDSQGSDFKTAFITPPGWWPLFPSQLCLWLRATPLFFKLLFSSLTRRRRGLDEE